MIVLPQGAFTVIADKKQEKTQAGIILTAENVPEPDTGIVAYTSEEMNKYQGAKVRFRRSFAEELPIEGVDHLYFRDFDSSVYYLIEQ